jgi:DNA-binding transcriptional LysR family regulator
MGRSERPSIEQLRAILMVDETGSLTAAAKELGVDQSVVSNRLRVFRGRQPLVRTRRNRVEFTDKGRCALPAIRDLIRRYDRLKQFLADTHASPLVLRVASGTLASQCFLPRAIARFRRELPDWDVQTRVLRGAKRIAGVVDGSCDLAIVTHNRDQVGLAVRSCRGSPAAIETSSLARQHFCVIARKKSPEAEQLRSVLAGQEIPLRMLLRWTLVGLDTNSGVRRQLEQKFATEKSGLRFFGEAGGWLAVKEYARQGLGVGLVPLATLSREDPSDLVVRRLSGEVFIEYLLIHRKAADDTGVEKMKSALRDAAREHEEELDRYWGGQL